MIHVQHTCLSLNVIIAIRVLSPSANYVAADVSLCAVDLVKLACVCVSSSHFLFHGRFYDSRRPLPPLPLSLSDPTFSDAEERRNES